MTDTLADALPREIARVTAKKERWIGYCKDMPELAFGMQLGIALMEAEINRAIVSLASGDVSAMLTAYSNLQDYDDE